MKRVLKYATILMFMAIIISIVIANNNYAIERNVLEIKDLPENYLNWSKLPDSEKKNYIQPVPFTVPYYENTLNDSKGINSQLKADHTSNRYDMRHDNNSFGEIEMIVRNQQQTSSCWAFSTTNMLSTNIQKLNLVDHFVKFSPRHMVYTTSDQCVGRANTKGYNKAPSQGANPYIGLYYITAGYGPILETDMPFVNSNEKIAASAIVEKDPEYKVNDFVPFPGIYKNYEAYENDENAEIVYHNGNGHIYTESELNAIRDSIKDHIVQYGGITATTYYNTTNPSQYFDSTGMYYYCNQAGQPANHSVTIVGWEDDYEATNFPADEHNRQPKHDGAYIVLNSHGEDKYDQGYMYVSYDDALIEQMLVGVVNTSKIDYDCLYQYDEYGYNQGIDIEGTPTYAVNVFNRKNNPENKKEYLREISIYVPTRSKIELYANAESDDKNSIIKLKDCGTVDIGYHTFKLDSPVEITGTKFVVGEKVTPIDANCALGAEMNLKANNSGDSSYNYDFWNNAKSNEGESWYSTNGTTWTDLYNEYADTNYCIKAFTTRNYEYEVEGISLDKSNLVLSLNEEFKLTPTISPENASNKNIIWSSTVPSVATVEQDGTVKGLTSGNTMIIAKTANGGFEATCAVEVTSGVTAVVLDKQEVTLHHNDDNTCTLVATVKPTTASNKTVIWSSSKPEIATVDQSGNITALSNGETTITARTADGNREATCKIIVHSKVKGVTLDRNSLNMDVVLDNTAKLVETINPDDATNKNVTWTSSDSDVVTVDEEGNVKALKVGTATITVTTEDDGYTDTCSVDVTSKVIGIEFDKNNVTLELNQIAKITATVKPDTAVNKTVEWLSSNPELVSVDEEGYIKASATDTGTAVITAKTEDGDYTAICNVVVISRVTGIDIDKKKLNLELGDKEKIEATVKPSNATNKKVEWTSSDSNIVTVDKLGNVKALNPGKATITVTTEDGNYAKVCNVVVVSRVTGIDIDKKELTIEQDDTAKIISTIKPDNATNKKVEWTSSDPNIVTVDKNGKIKGIKIGKAIVTVASKDGDFKASCNVNVIEKKIAVKYQAHMQNLGWQSYVTNGETTGNPGKTNRIEGLKIKLVKAPSNAKITYQAHVQDLGWQKKVSNGVIAGTTGKFRRMEAIKINLENMPGYVIQYRVYVQNKGWQNWVCNGEVAGTTGEARRIEAIQIRLLKVTSIGVSYKTHIQDLGWQKTVSNGTMSGTIGRAYRIEGLTACLDNAPSNAKITYQAHVQNKGWQNSVSNGKLAGTTGKFLRMEAVKIKLENMPGYTVQYQTNVQDKGWQPWVFDGVTSGTTGKGLRIEGIKIRVLQIVK